MRHGVSFALTTITLGFATSTTPHSTPIDPAETEALQCLEKGTQKLEEGDVEGAKLLYQRSVEIKRDAGALFNLGVTHYHLSSSRTNSLSHPWTSTHLASRRGVRPSNPGMEGLY